MEKNDSFISSDVVVIDDPQALEKKKAAIHRAGLRNLQVIADFDSTLTMYWNNGQPWQSSYSILQTENPECDLKRQKLYEYHYPLENSPTISIEEKTKLMEEWCQKTQNLLIEGGLTYNAIKNSISAGAIALREGVVELFEYLEEKGVPILIISAGITDIIEEVFKQKLHRTFKNIKIVSNRMVFADDGRLVSFKGKTIHVHNKNEHALDMAEPVDDQLGGINEPTKENDSHLKNRTNVLLLGDHIGDLGMSHGLNYDNQIAVGFLNDNVEKSLDKYKKAFDIVYLNDSPMWGVVDLVSQLCSSTSTGSN